MITIDFVTRLPRTTLGYDLIWVIVDRLIKSAHFLPIRTIYSVAQYVRLYIREIVRLHGVSASIMIRGPSSLLDFRENCRRHLAHS